jgi:hypothetical protein
MSIKSDSLISKEERVKSWHKGLFLQNTAKSISSEHTGASIDISEFIIEQLKSCDLKDCSEIHKTIIDDAIKHYEIVVCECMGILGIPLEEDDDN